MTEGSDADENDQAESEPDRDDEPENASERQRRLIDEYNGDFTPMSEIKATPPVWNVEGLLVPGLNFVVSPAKHYKSYLIFCILAATIHKAQIPGLGYRPKIRQHNGGVVLFAPEQGMQDIKHIYESRVIQKPWPKGPVSWDFILANEPMNWRLDVDPFERDPHYDLCRFLHKWKPFITVLDPWNHFHVMDENDARMAHLLLEPKKIVKGYGGSLAVVHHEKKPGKDDGGSPNMNRMRGTSAMWALADGGIQLSKVSGGTNGSPITMNIYSEFKNYPARNVTWRIGNGTKQRAVQGNAVQGRSVPRTGTKR
jgi:hypothetical protein